MLVLIFFFILQDVATSLLLTTWGIIINTHKWIATISSWKKMRIGSVIYAKKNELNDRICIFINQSHMRDIWDSHLYGDIRGDRRACLFCRSTPRDGIERIVLRMVSWCSEPELSPCRYFHRKARKGVTEIAMKVNVNKRKRRFVGCRASYFRFIPCCNPNRIEDIKSAHCIKPVEYSR